MTDPGPIARSTTVQRLLVALDRTATDRTDRVSLDRIGGRTLADDVVAPRSVPAVDYSTMDGYAVATEDDGPRTIVGSVYPQDEPPSIDAGEAVAIATGAPLPARADAVVMREEANVEERPDEPDLLADPGIEPGTNVTPAGTTAGEGEVLFRAGGRLAARHAALLRDVGIETVRVDARRSVAVLATGTEIHEGEQPDRDSELLANLARGWGLNPTLEGSVPDEETAVRSAIEELASEYDLVLTTGGTGVGHADYVTHVLGSHDRLFAGVALRPGRPMTAAVVDDALVCGFPGKPLAAYLDALLVLGPALAGDPPLPTVAATFDHTVAVPGTEATFAIPVALDGNRAIPLGHADSAVPIYEDRFRPGRVSANTRITTADGVVLTETDLDAGATVGVVPFDALE